MSPQYRVPRGGRRLHRQEGGARDRQGGDRQQRAGAPPEQAAQAQLGGLGEEGERPPDERPPAACPTPAAVRDPVPGQRLLDRDPGAQVDGQDGRQQRYLEADRDGGHEERRAQLQHGRVHAQVRREVAVEQVAQPDAEREPGDGAQRPVDRDANQVAAQHLAVARPDRLHGADHGHLLGDQGHGRAQQQEDAEQQRDDREDLHDREDAGDDRAAPARHVTLDLAAQDDHAVRREDLAELAGRRGSLSVVVEPDQRDVGAVHVEQRLHVGLAHVRARPAGEGGRRGAQRVREAGHAQAVGAGADLELDAVPDASCATDWSEDSIRISPAPGSRTAVSEGRWKERLLKSPIPTMLSGSWPDAMAQRAEATVSAAGALTLCCRPSSAASGAVVGAVTNWMSGWPVVSLSDRSPLLNWPRCHRGGAEAHDADRDAEHRQRGVQLPPRDVADRLRGQRVHDPTPATDTAARPITRASSRLTRLAARAASSGSWVM